MNQDTTQATNNGDKSNGAQPAALERLSYDELFTAIADATHISDGEIVISVGKFRKTIGAIELARQGDGADMCPACEQPGARPTYYSSTIVPLSGEPSYTAHGLEGDYCSHCGETFINMEKGRLNDVRYDQARAAAVLAANG